MNGSNSSYTVSNLAITNATYVRGTTTIFPMDILNKNCGSLNVSVSLGNAITIYVKPEVSNDVTKAPGPVGGWYQISSVSNTQTVSPTEYKFSASGLYTVELPTVMRARYFTVSTRSDTTSAVGSACMVSANIGTR